MKFFPHDKIRPEQEKLLQAVESSLDKKRNLVVHAPTGLGKTAATITPALEFALEKNLTVFYLTSRHTQHKIVIDTLKKIKEKHNVSFTSTDLIGKKHMCPVPGIKLVTSGEFNDYCKTAREKKTCEYFMNTKKENKLTVEAKQQLSELIFRSTMHAEDVIESCSGKKLCPYYISTELASNSQLVLADYNIIFNTKIRNALFNNAKKNLEKCVIIVDEAHNLPDRIRNISSDKTSSIIIALAAREAKKFGYDNIVPYLNAINDTLNFIAGEIETEPEGLVEKNEFVNKINLIKNYDDLIEELNTIGDEIRKEQKRSFVGSVARFLEIWKGPDEGFTRIISFRRGPKPVINLYYKCLDPAIISEPIIDEAYSTIFMSGTMNPTEMYKEVLGIKNCDEAEYECPFPKQNRLNLIVPLTTTKYTARNDMQFQNIANICSETINSVPGNIAVFFPSYDIKDKVFSFLSSLSKKTVFSESQGLTKEEKKELLEKFSSYKEKGGAVLLAVASGSFGEGIDLPGILSGVIVVGLPLKVPDLETKQTMQYYQDNF
ncbi:ATP-dependent DNA helicase, partial [Candidatus Woesearchaeota archaeon]|nr:ATP-dependent DNA helicase [Candidatus Woesearchaeota archaeon]